MKVAAWILSPSQDGNSQLPSSQGSAIPLPSSRGSGSDRGDPQYGDPGVRRSHAKGNDGLPRSLHELAMTNG